MIEQIFYALPFLGEGFAVTLWVSFLVVALSLIAGVALGVGLVYGPAPLRWAVRMLTDTIRGIPILVLLFFVYYGLPAVGIQIQLLLGSGARADAFQDGAGDRDTCVARSPRSRRARRKRRKPSGSPSVTASPM